MLEGGASTLLASPEQRQDGDEPPVHGRLGGEDVDLTFLFRRLTAGPEGGATISPMSDRAVARLAQLRVAQAGYVAADLAGHSPRAGFLTAAARSGASVFKMREASRHRSVQVLADHVRDAELFRDHAGEGFL